jgi:hypothetical protein
MWVRPKVVGFDVVKVGGGLESVILPIQLAHPTRGGGEELSNEYKTGRAERYVEGIGWENLPMDVRVAVANGSNVALEMGDIDGIESDLSTHRISILRI